MKKMTLGSLFDGSGGFPLAARMCGGIEPIWASEIEPYCIRVTKKNFPYMKHYGDITKINGADIEPVDIITFGSPCQDLSIAGKREGLEGERSGLFLEAVRLIKEMRDATQGAYPNYIIWENVFGALSSTNKGDDFWTVLKEIYGITQEELCIPRLEKWTKAGEILGDGCSLAWRTMDAQYWGVPQIRRRVFLVADLRGHRAGKILFEQEGMRWDNRSIEKDRKKAAAKVRANAPCTVQERHGKPGGGKGVLVQVDKSATLDCGNSQILFDTGYRETMDHGYIKSELAGPLKLSSSLGSGGSTIVADTTKSIVRKLTPLECCRLQGFPDDWCDGIEGSDSAQYAMWGNGVALPVVYFIMSGIQEVANEME